MTILRLASYKLEDCSPETITELRKNRFPTYAEGYNNSFMDKIEENIGFIIIGIMFVGALVWTILMV